MSCNIAFYGAGRRAQPYLDALARRPDVTLVAVCDPDRRAAEQTAAGWGARVFPTWTAMVEEARPEALWICVPAALQGEVVLRAAEMRLPFFVVPPGAATFEQAREGARRVSAAGLVTAVGFAARYADIVQEAREYLGANPIPLALGWWLSGPGEETGISAAQLLWAEGCRLVDSLRAYCGDVTRVRALSPGGNPGGLLAQLEFVSGSVGVLTCTNFARPEPRIEVELLGEGWSIVLDEGPAVLRLAERDKTTILRRLNDPASDHTAAFLAAVSAGAAASVASGYADACGTLAVCHAALVSSRENRPVELAEFAVPAATAAVPAKTAAEPAPPADAS